MEFITMIEIMLAVFGYIDSVESIFDQYSKGTISQTQLIEKLTVLTLSLTISLMNACSEISSMHP